MGTVKYEAAAITSLLTTELDSLANGAGALGVEYDNATGLYFWGDFELLVAFGTAPTADSVVELYLIPAADGTNYGDGAGGPSPVAPRNHYVGAWALRAVTTAQRLVLQGVPLPPLMFKALVVNKSGQPFPASGSTVRIVPYRTQVV